MPPIIQKFQVARRLVVLLGRFLRGHIALLVLVLASASAQADPVSFVSQELGKPPTPEGLHATYDEATETLTLAWGSVAGFTPEPNGSDYYVLYQDGELLWTGATAEHSLQLPSQIATASVFQVSVKIDGEESLRSAPATVGQVENPLTTCDVATITINPNGPPFYGYQLRPECLTP